MILRQRIIDLTNMLIYKLNQLHTQIQDLEMSGGNIIPDWLQVDSLQGDYIENVPTKIRAATNADVDNWNEAFNWNNHALEGYLTEVDLTGYATEVWVISKNYLTSVDIAGKADKVTTIGAGVGLIGGGSLAANRTLTVKYGTIAGTATQGNDARLLEVMAKKVIGVTVTGNTNKIITITREDGTTLTASFLDNAGTNTGSDGVVDYLEFDSATGIFKATTTTGSSVTVPLDGRYSLLGHSHAIGEITGLQTILDGLQPFLIVTAKRLLGRYDSTDGEVEEIVVGSGLKLSAAGVLSSLVCKDYEVTLIEDSVIRYIPCTGCDYVEIEEEIKFGTFQGTKNFGGNQAYPFEDSLDVANFTGTVTVTPDAITVPDRFIIYGNNTVLLDTGYRGSEPHGIGGSSRTAFKNSLEGRVDPITQNTYPFTSPQNDVDGYPIVYSPGKYTDTFEASSSYINYTLKVYAPMPSTGWKLDYEYTRELTGVFTISSSSEPEIISGNATITCVGMKVINHQHTIGDIDFGGLSTQFVKGDGSLDSSIYLTLVDLYSYALKSWVIENFVTTDTTYTAGNNIAISATNKISAVDTLYTAGNGITLSAKVFSMPVTIVGSGNFVQNVVQNANGITVTLGILPIQDGAIIYTAGTNVQINGSNEISATDTKYSAGSGLKMIGTTFSLPVTIEGTGSFVVSVVQTQTGITITLGTPPNSNTTYSLISSADLEAGISTSSRVVSAERLHTWLVGKGYLTSVDLTGFALESWVNANFDKYVSFNLKTQSVQRIAITSGGTLDIIGSTNVTVTYSSGGRVNISATDTTYEIFTGTTPGLVPASTGTTKYLKEDGTWASPPNQTYSIMSVSSINAGTEATARLVSAKLLADWILTFGFITSYQNTKYSAGAGLTLSGTTFSLPITITGTGTYVQSVVQTATGIEVTLGTPPDNNTTYSSGSVAYLDAGTSNTSKVWSANVLATWLASKGYITTYENTTYSAGNGLTLSGTVFSLPINIVGTGSYVQSIVRTSVGLTVTLGTPPDNNTTYSSGSVALLDTGTSGTNRVWSALHLATWLAGKGYITSYNDTKYYAGDGLKMIGTTFSLPVTIVGSGTFVVSVIQNSTGITITMGTPPNSNTTYSLISASLLAAGTSGTAYLISAERLTTWLNSFGFSTQTLTAGTNVSISSNKINALNTTYDPYTGTTAGLVPTGANSTSKYLREDGTWYKPPNTGNTTYSAGDGLLLVSNTFSIPINTTGSGSYIRSITANALGLTVALGNPPNTGDTTYSAGDGLKLFSNTFSIPINTTGSGSYIRSITANALGLTVALGNPPDSNTTYSSGTSTLLDAGTDSSQRVWSAKILKPWLDANFDKYSGWKMKVGSRTVTVGSNRTVEIEGGVNTTVTQSPTGKITIDSEATGEKTIKEILLTRYTLLQADTNVILHFMNINGCTVTASNNLTTNSRFEGKQLSKGSVTVKGSGLASILVCSPDSPETAGINAVFALDMINATEFVMYGRLKLSAPIEVGQGR